MFEDLLHGFEQKLAAEAQTAIRELVEQARMEVEHITRAVVRERKRGLEEVARARRALDEERKAMEHVCNTQDSQVVLDVGGCRYNTSVATLRSKPGTMLDAMFSGRHAIDTAEDGSVFIDRDGHRFGYVLDYLRDGVVTVEDGHDARLLRQLKREFDFYAIELYVPQPLCFVAGGKDGTHSKAFLEAYDPDHDKWMELQPMRQSRYSFGICQLSDHMYVVGGYRGGTGGYLKTVERYAHTSDTWEMVAPMPEARSHTGACAVDGLMFVLGGHNTEGQVTDTVVKYDPTHDAWRALASMPQGRIGFGTCVIGLDIYVVGGFNGTIAQSTVFKYDTRHNEWSIAAPLPQASCGLSVCALDGMIYAVGGSSANRTRLQSAYRYDPATNVWTELQPMPMARSFFGLSAFRGCLYAAGGYIRNHTTTAEVHRYDPAIDQWSCAAPMSHARGGVGTCVATVQLNKFDHMIQASKHSQGMRDD